MKVKTLEQYLKERYPTRKLRKMADKRFNKLKREYDREIELRLKPILNNKTNTKQWKILNSNNSNERT